MTDDKPDKDERPEDNESADKRRQLKIPLGMSRKRPGGNPPAGGGDNRWKNASKTLAFWLILLLLSIGFIQLFNRVHEEEVSLSFSQYQEMLKGGMIVKAYMIENEFHGTLKEAREMPGLGHSYTRFKTILPFIDSKMLETWDSVGLVYQFKRESVNWVGFFLQLLPWILFIGFWLFIFRQMQGGGPKGIFKFGKSKARLMTEDRPKITFADVAGAVEAKQELQEIIEFLKEPSKFQKLGGKIPKGALMVGPPGTGKTLLAKAVAGEAKVPFFSMSGSDFVEMFVGVGASRVRDLFEQGKRNAPCIIFIDEIDAVGRHRGAGLGGGHDEREQTLNQLLAEMDGFETNDGVIIMAATNRPDVLDPALMRPGRFDRQIVVDRPDVRGREGILAVHTKKVPLGHDVDIKVLARGTPGFSGADLANMVNEGALLAARRNKKMVEMADLEDAKDKVMMGTERRSLVISPEERKIVAYHESGHALVAKKIPDCDPIHKVTIIPRGRALGLTHSLPEQDHYLHSKDWGLSQICCLLGGRLAEEIFFGRITSGSANDIERATQISRMMVCEWGMSDKMGPLTFGKKEEEIFLGREISKHRDYSEKTARVIDDEVKNIVMQMEQKTREILTKYKDQLTLIAEALLEREILDGHEIDMLINGEKLEPLKVEKIHLPEEKPSASEAATNEDNPPLAAGDSAPAMA
jgi:cell division protease FtsH